MFRKPSQFVSRLVIIILLVFGTVGLVSAHAAYVRSVPNTSRIMITSLDTNCDGFLNITSS
jgi:hypothetical protein